jgi:hypothetical protein
MILIESISDDCHRQEHDQSRRRGPLRGTPRKPASGDGLSRSCTTSVVFHVGFGGFGGVVGGVFMVSLREDGMVGSFFMVPGFVVLGRFTVVSSSMFVMLGGGTVMLSRFFGHDGPLLFQFAPRSPSVVF